MNNLQSQLQIFAIATASLLAGFLLFGGRRAVAASDDIPKIGQPAPDFALPSQDGSMVRLADYRGKWVVLYFYPKDNTPGCTMEAHRFQLDLPQYERQQAVVIGVSLDSAASHQNFCTKQGLTFKLLSDQKKEVAVRYGSLKNMLGLKMAARNTFLIGPDGKIARLWLGVDPGSHSAQVLAALVEARKKG